MVKGFSVILNAAEVFLEFYCFVCPMNRYSGCCNLISSSSASLKSSLYIWKFFAHILLKPSLKDLSIALLACEMSAVVWYFEYVLALSFFEIWMKIDLRINLQKVGFNWRKQGKPLGHSCDLNQIPYDYILEGTTRFKGSDLVDGVPEKLWTEVHNIVQEAVTINILKKKKCKKTKWLSEEALQIGEERREVKGKKERERYTQLNAEFRTTTVSFPHLQNLWPLLSFSNLLSHWMKHFNSIVF